MLVEPRGQTVSWWLYSGDERVNAYVHERGGPAARRLGLPQRFELDGRR